MNSLYFLNQLYNKEHLAMKCNSCAFSSKFLVSTDGVAVTNSGNAMAFFPACIRIFLGGVALLRVDTHQLKVLCRQWHDSKYLTNAHALFLLLQTLM